jgi:glutaredoxin
MGAIWSGYNTENQPNMQVWQGSLGSAATGQQEAASYPQGYGSLPGTSNPNSPYAGYLEKQIRDYPVMIYSLNECVPCQRAKQLIATSYPDARAHYLDLSGNEVIKDFFKNTSSFLAMANAITIRFDVVNRSKHVPIHFCFGKLHRR